MQELAPRWWQFWKWHFHRCRVESDDTGVWGECLTCHRRFGFVTRDELRGYTDKEMDFEARRRL